MMVKVQTKGLREALETLKRVPKEALGKGNRTKPVRQALRQGANIVRNSARSKAPKDTGRLAKAIKVRSKSRRFLRATQEGVQLWIDPGKSRSDQKGAFYGMWVEFGTSKMPARPFMRNALESESGAAIAEVVRVFRSKVDDIVRQARRG